MPLARPTLDELKARNEAEISARLGIGPLLRRSVLQVLARVFAGGSHELHGHLEWLSANMLPDEAEGPELERWASILTISRKAATFASGTAEASGSDGSTIPAGTFVRRADGAKFKVQTDATVAGGVATLELEAELAGLDGDTEATTVLRLVSPVAGVQPSVEVLDPGLEGGLEAETDEELRARVLQRLRQPPQGGSEPDYVRWALEVPGVTRAWSFRNYLGLGTVGVAFMVDDDPTGPFPSPAQVAEVQAYIEDGRRPVTAQVYVFSPLPLPVDFQLEISPNDAATQAAATAQLRDLFTREAVPGGTLPLSHVSEALSTTPGETDSAVVVPAADIVAPAGALPILGTIIWV